MKDKSGRDIQPGDLIVYGYALGRCAALNYGKVLEVKTSPTTKEEVVHFIGLLQCYMNGESYWGLQKPSVLRFSERILVVERAQVPQDMLKVLAP